MRASLDRRAANVDVTDRPCPTITNGVNGLNSCHFKIVETSEGDTVQKKRKEPAKPPYRVPLMSEVAKLPWNGLTVASTFSGCGGLCTGYRMAGFRVAWANEFVPAAQDSYAANMAAGGFLDRRDIHAVKAGDVLAKLGVRKGQLDLLDGSPPCQAFSTAGKRHKGWGDDKEYEHGAKQKNETLFEQYLRLLRGLEPKTFVAENVSGLVKGTAKGMFLQILGDMKAAGYRVSCRVLDAQWLGVPQQRQRTIFVGVREDLGAEPCHPEPLPWRYSVRDALPWLDGVVHENGGFSRTEVDGYPSPTVTATQCRMSGVDNGQRITGVNRSSQWKPGVEFSGPDRPHGTVGTSPSSGCGKAGGAAIETAGGAGFVERRKFTIAELRRICSFPDDFVLTGSYAQQWERLGNSVPPVMMFWVARTVRDRVLLPLLGKPAWRHDPGCLVPR